MLPSPKSLLAAVRDPAESVDAIAAVLPALTTSRYLLLTTVKRDGSEVGTPVWFAASDGSLVAMSEATAWKVKRLRRNPKATVAPCDVRGRVHGPAIAVVGEVLGEAESAQARSALHRRYGSALDAIDVVGRIRARGRAPERAFMAFRPETGGVGSTVE